MPVGSAGIMTFNKVFFHSLHKSKHMKDTVHTYILNTLLSPSKARLGITFKERWVNVLEKRTEQKTTLNCNRYAFLCTSLNVFILMWSCNDKYPSSLLTHTTQRKSILIAVTTGITMVDRNQKLNRKLESWYLTPRCH